MSSLEGCNFMNFSGCGCLTDEDDPDATLILSTTRSIAITAITAGCYSILSMALINLTS